MGMVTKINPQFLADGAWPLLRNCDLSEPGIIAKRSGKTIPTTLTTTLGSNRVRGLGHYHREGSPAKVLAVAGAALSTWDGSTTWAAVAGALASGVNYEIVQADNLAFLLSGDGASNVRSYNGTAIVDEGHGLASNTDPPRAKFGVYHLNRLFLAGEAANPTYLWFSTILDTQAWNYGSNVFKFGQGSGQVITGLALYRNFELIVFLDKSIEVLLTDPPGSSTPLSDWSRQVLDPRIGCASNATIQPVGEDIFFIDQDGHLRSLNRTIQDAAQGAISTPLSDPIRPDVEQFNKTKLSEAVGRVFSDRYYLLSVAMSGSDRPNRIYVYDISQHIWMGYWDGLSAASMDIATMVVSDVEGQGQRIYGGSGTAIGEVWQLLAGVNDDGVAIELEAISKAYDMGQPEADKVYSDTEVRANATDTSFVDVYASMDFNDFAPVGNFSLLGSAPQLPIALPFDLAESGEVRGKFHLDQFQRGRTLRLRYLHNTLDSEVELKGHTMTALLENYDGEE